MQTRSTLAVVDDKYFYTVGRRWEHGGFDRLERLLTEAKACNLTHVWILEKSLLSTRLGALNAEYQGWSVSPIMPSQEHIGFCSAIWGREADKPIKIGFAEWIPWPWYYANNPKTLLATIALLEDALGFPIEWTPAHAALDFVKLKNIDRWNWFSRMPVDLEKAYNFRYSEITGELDWVGQLPPLLPTDFQPVFVEKIDINSEYGSAMTGLRVGEGTPVWSKEGDEYDRKRPGFWRVCALIQDSHWDGGQLPRFDHLKWMTTDLIEQLRSVGYHIQIDGGWFWEKYHQTLRSTISDKNHPGLWDMRVYWRHRRGESVAHDNVYESISAILHTVHGKFGDDKLSQTRFRRPDILALVMARALAMRIYKMEKIRRDFGLLPSKIKIDAAWYALERPDQLDAILDQDKLGGWKEIYTLEITEELRAAWPTLTTGELNRWPAWHGGERMIDSEPVSTPH